MVRHHAQTSDADLAASLALKWWRLHETELSDLTDGTPLDHRLIELDSDRTMVTDIELDNSEGEDVYVRLLRQLGKLSGGSFKPLRVSEDWEVLQSRVVVRFRHDGHQLELVVKICHDYIDPFAITQLNELFDPGPRFWFIDNGGQEAILTRATRAERAPAGAPTGQAQFCAAGLVVSSTRCLVTGRSTSTTIEVRIDVEVVPDVQHS